MTRFVRAFHNSIAVHSNPWDSSVHATPFGALKPFPILIPSDFGAKNGFPAVKALSEIRCMCQSQRFG